MRKGLASCKQGRRHSSNLEQLHSKWPGLVRSKELELELIGSMALGLARSKQVLHRNGYQRRRNKRFCGNGTNRLQR